MSRVRGHRLNYPSMMGAYLAINGIPDAYILIDGPDCALYKSHFIHGRHDLNSTLLDINGNHRVCFTNICAQSVTKDHNDVILRKVHAIEMLENSRAVFLTALPGCSLTGIDYDHLMRGAGTFMQKEAISIPPTSLVGDWLDGFAIAMRTLVRHMPLPGIDPKPENVAIVGYMMDRNEGDHRGNLKELRRMIEALGLKLVSTWFSCQPYDELARGVQTAGTILSFPHGREAAAELAKKTGAQLVVCDLPFGLQATERWIRQLAAATGREKAAKKLITEERRRILSRLEWIAPYIFLHKEATFIGDPYHMEGFMETCEDLGMTVRDCFLTSRDRPVSERATGMADTILFEPDIYHPDVNRFLGDPTELVVTTTNDVSRIFRWHTIEKFCIVELGFPSYFHHALVDEPYLGFEGFLNFAGRMANALHHKRRLQLVKGDSDEEEEDETEMRQEFARLNREARPEFTAAEDK
ncbi:MAG: nitrogenase component 1 [Elusimicrobiota bacterium]